MYVVALTNDTNVLEDPSLSLKGDPLSHSYVDKACAYCEMSIRHGEDILVCPSCHLPYHRDCWAENARFKGFRPGIEGIRLADPAANGTPKAATEKVATAPLPDAKPVWLTPALLVLSLLIGIVIGRAIGSAGGSEERFSAAPPAPVTTETSAENSTAETAHTPPPAHAPDALGGMTLATLSSEEAETIIAEQATNVLAALKKRDTAALVKIVHPTLGVRFSSMPKVNLQSDLVTKADILPGAMKDKKEYTWGIDPASNKPITLTFADYMKRYVYDAEYESIGTVSYNELPPTARPDENLYDYYRDAIVVKYHVTDPEPGRIGAPEWRSLYLVFQQHEAAWFLVGVVHDEGELQE
jgi:hypothetical protein